MIVNTSANPVTAIISSLASIGAINWGLVGVFNFNLVAYIFGESSSLTKIVYALVGVCGLYSLFTLTRVICKPCVKEVA